MVHAVQSGHPGGSLGRVEFFHRTLFRYHGKTIPHLIWMRKEEDVFFLSNGHISPVFYSVLARRGYFEVSELKNIRKLNTRLQGHPTTAEHLPGVRHGIGFPRDKAYLSHARPHWWVKKWMVKIPWRSLLHGDGELQEDRSGSGYVCSA